MRYRKRKIAFIMAGFLCLSACANSAAPSVSDGDTAEVSESTTSEGDVSSGDVETAAQSLPVVSVENRTATRYAEDGETQLVEIRQDCMVLEGTGYEKAAEAVARLLYTEQDTLEAQADSMAELAGEELREQLEQDAEAYFYFSPYYEEADMQVERLDSRVLSVKVSSYEYSGGAHGYGGDGGITIDLESGVELELSHLTDDFSGFMDKSREIVLQELAEREDELFPDYAAYVEESLENVNWYLDAAGVEFCFTPYEIGPYASGNIVVCVPYNEVADYLKPEYGFTQETGIQCLPVNQEVILSGTEGQYSIMMGSRELEEYENELFLMVGEEETVLGQQWLEHAYLMSRPDGKQFVIFDVDWASDDFETFVYDVTDGKMEQTADVWAELDGGNIQLDRVNLQFTLNVFGTYGSDMPHAFTDEGELTALGERYEIEQRSDWQGLTTIRELPVTVDGQNMTLPVGTKLSITATDNQGTAWFTAEDEGGNSIEGEIHYERIDDDYQLYVDGVSEYEYFETLPYAG